VAEYSAWQRSAHGRAGGTPSTDLVIAPFNGAPIRFANALVIARRRADVYEFVVQRPGDSTITFRIEGVVGGGHIYGGGTQAFFTPDEDGTLRLLPFEWSRHNATWFCNTNSRSRRGWVPITRATRLEECGDWPPVRVIGDHSRFANCQSCHASQATLALDTVARRYVTRYTSLAVNCEACHGPARRHVEWAERGMSGTDSTVGFGRASLATFGKDASLGVCYQCHALKDKLRDGFLSGDSLGEYYSTKLPLLGERPLHADGRTRTFAYQEAHQYSDCYLNGGLTCTSCHDPHSQQYRNVWGAPIPGRLSDAQCTSCHASKAEAPTSHTKHPADVTCVSCHMPFRQEPETRAASGTFANTTVVPYTRSDHTISIPRPAVDSSLGLVSACSACHAGMSAAEQEKRIHEWWGELKPPASNITRNVYARFARVARYLEDSIQPNVPPDASTEHALEELASAGDADVRAAALAALHLANGENRKVRRLLARALRSRDDVVLRPRWSVALGFMGDRFASRGQTADALTAYTRALEVQPNNAALWLSQANTQRVAGDPNAAVESYRKSLALDAVDPLAWVNFGIALGAVGDTVSAVDALTRATRLNPFEPLAWFNLGNISLVRGDLSRASALYARTAALDPSIALANFQLARVSLLQNDARAALRHLRRGLAFDSSDASAREAAALLAHRK
jgi:tetratricopeptide (TPR) repeat protein/protein-arginine kinase activator protein McsA